MASSQRMMLLLFSVTIIMSQASAMVVMHMGMSCPNPEVKADFDVTQYTGRWFEYERFPNTFEMGAKCTIANYTLLSEDSVKVVNTAIQEYSYGTGICPWYQSTVAVGDAEVYDAEEPAKLGVRFSQYAPRGNYWVLETDYVTYSVVYSCSQMMGVMPVYTEIAWVLTRERGVAPPQLDAIHQRLADAGIDPSYFEVTDHKSCPEWPAED